MYLKLEYSQRKAGEDLPCNTRGERKTKEVPKWLPDRGLPFVRNKNGAR